LLVVGWSLDFCKYWLKVINILNLRELFLWCSPAAFLLFLAATPSFILSGLKMQNEGTNLRLSFWKKVSLGILGGIVGEITAFAMLWPAESSWCRDMSAQGSYCDGQGPLVLIITVPIAAIFASSISMLWSWFGLRIPANNPWTSVFSYRGKHRVVNAGTAVAIQAVYWAIFALAVYRLTRNLL
jgi:hypothetical protein